MKRIILFLLIITLITGAFSCVPSRVSVGVGTRQAYVRPYYHYYHPYYYHPRWHRW